MVNIEKSGESVQFLFRKHTMAMGHAVTYLFFKCNDAQTAWAFLEYNPVKKPLYYLIVETSDGVFGRDTEGIYQIGNITNCQR